MISRNAEKLQQVITECEGDDHKFASIDVTDTEKLDNFITDHVNSCNIPFDGLVYSAGI